VLFGLRAVIPAFKRAHCADDAVEEIRPGGSYGSRPALRRLAPCLGTRRTAPPFRKARWQGPWTELEHVSAEEAVYGVSQAHVRKSRQRGRPRIPGASSNSSRGCGEESHLGEEGFGELPEARTAALAGHSPLYGRHGRIAVVDGCQRSSGNRINLDFRRHHSSVQVTRDVSGRRSAALGGGRHHTLFPNAACAFALIDG
jgi:hypothetical protein